MKKSISLVISLLLICAIINGNGRQTEQGDRVKNSVTILTSQDVFGLSSVWAAEFNRLNPGTMVSVKMISGPSAQNVFGQGTVGIITSGDFQSLSGETTFSSVAGRDVIVPVINSENPLVSELNEKGFSPETLGRILSGSLKPVWGSVIGNNNTQSLNLYLTDDDRLKKCVQGFLNIGDIKIDENEVKTSEELITAIRNDINSIGFCKLASLVNVTTQSLAKGIRILPVDRNGNGVIDANEDIYADLNTFARGVWIGKYPKSLISNIYAVTASNPENESASSLIKWILSDGQQYLGGTGFSELLVSERMTSIDKLNSAQVAPASTSSGINLFRALILILAFLILVIVAVDLFFRYVRRQKAGMLNPVGQSIRNISENSVLIPKGLYYDKTHTWAFMEQNGKVKVGIDDFIQHVTGSITRIKMKKVGQEVKKGEELMSIIHNGKQLNLYAPVSGVIIEQNKVLEENASLINSSPYNEGWIYRIEPTNWFRENHLLFVAEKQHQYIAGEFTKLKDFLAGVFKEDEAQLSFLVLQDGGELKDGVLADLGPEVWEDFQTNFIDPSRKMWFYEMF